MLFSDKKEGNFNQIVKMVLTVHSVQCHFPKKGEELEIPQRKIASTVHGTMIFAKKEEDLNNQVEDIVNGTQGTVVIS